MEKKEKERGESLRITRTLIWLFYPLAWQRTKCIDSSAIAPPVSGMYFIHPTAKTQCIYGHHANESTFLVIGKRERAVLVNMRSYKAERDIYILKKKVKPTYIVICYHQSDLRRTPEKETKRNRWRGQSSNGKREFFLFGQLPLQSSRHPWRSQWRRKLINNTMRI